MVTVDYKSLVDGAAELIWGDSSSAPDSDDWHRLKRLFSKRLATAWERAFWPDLMRAERRAFRPAWDSSATYAASTSATPVELFHHRSLAYYQSLKGGNTGNEPADANGKINYAWWYPCRKEYSAADWAASTAYTAGSSGVEPSVVRNPADGRHYACISSHTSGSAFDSAKFTVLTEFDQYVGWDQAGETKIGTVRGVTLKDPRNHYDAGEVNYELSHDGIQVLDAVARVWVWFRLRAPRLHGGNYSSAVAYTAGVSQVYYRNDNNAESYPGNFYDCVASTSAGESPESAPGKWTVVEVPRMFERYLVQAVYADWLPGAGQNEKKRLESEFAEQLLNEQMQLLRGQQGQRWEPKVTIRN